MSVPVTNAENEGPDGVAVNRDNAPYLSIRHPSGAKIYDFVRHRCVDFARLSALSAFIGHIIRVRSEKKMVWINTGRIITLMQYLFASWNLTEVKYPRDAMGGRWLPLTGQFDLAVMPPRKARSGPNPTLSQLWNKRWPIFVDRLPKSFNDRDATGHVFAFPRAIAPLSAKNLRPIWRDEVSAASGIRACPFAYRINVHHMIGGILPS